MPRPLLALIPVALLAFASCDDTSEPAPELPSPPTGPAKQQIASTVNSFFAAWNAGDGELACSYLTERGQRLAIRIAPQLHALAEEEPIEPDDCVEAIELSADTVTEPIGQRAAPGRVRIDGPDRAVVVSRFRGELSLRRVEGVWLIEVPTYID